MRLRRRARPRSCTTARRTGSARSRARLCARVHARVRGREDGEEEIGRKGGCRHRAISDPPPHPKYGKETKGKKEKEKKTNGALGLPSAGAGERSQMRRTHAADERSTAGRDGDKDRGTQRCNALPTANRQALMQDCVRCVHDRAPNAMQRNALRRVALRCDALRCKALHCDAKRLVHTHTTRTRRRRYHEATRTEYMNAEFKRARGCPPLSSTSAETAARRMTGSRQ